MGTEFGRSVTNGGVAIGGNEGEVVATMTGLDVTASIVRSKVGADVLAVGVPVASGALVGCCVAGGFCVGPIVNCSVGGNVGT